MNSTLVKGLILLPLLIIGSVFAELPSGLYSPSDVNTFVVVLDAGHGGHDPGNLGNGYLEKNIALKIVLAAGKELNSNKDIKVVYTRKDDSFVDLFVRGEIANKANADIFVSVHCDSHSSDAHGAGTFVLGLHANKQNFEIAKKENSVIYLEDDYETRYSEYDINSPESVIGLTIMQEEFLEKSILLARKMQQNFAGGLKRRDRQVKQAGFIVLHQTFMPSVLIETGFLTNRNEGAYLNSKKGQSEMGKAIADAIVAYKNEVIPNTVVAYSEPDFAEAPSTSPQILKEEEKPIEQVVQKVEEKKPEQPKKEASDEAVSAVEKELNTPTEVDFKESQKEDAAIKEIAKEDTSAKEAGTVIQKPVAEKPKEEEIKKPDVQAAKEEVAVTKKPEVQTAKEEDVPAKTQADIEKEAPKTEAVIKEKSSSVEYRVQILASAKKLELDPGNFKGLNNLSREPFKNLYRYMYGKTSSYEQVKLFKANADAKGYTTSYIVAYLNGERVGVNEALAHQKTE